MAEVISLGAAVAITLGGLGTAVVTAEQRRRRALIPVRVRRNRRSS